MLSAMVRLMFWSRVHDVYCGLRGFRKDFVESLDLRSGGMEFAAEMVVKSTLRDARITEVPITLHPDGRRAHPPHLKTFRDGWRTLRLFLMNSPRWLFLYPGACLVAIGLVGYALALPGARIGGIRFDAHTLLFSSLAVLVGFQAVSFALLVKTFAIREGLLPDNRRMAAFHRVVTLERALVVSLVVLAAGVLLLASAVNEWRVAGFGDLDYAHTMRVVVPGTTLTALGFQALLAAFVLAVLRTPDAAAGRGV
jgi:hypothetical protein